MEMPSISSAPRTVEDIFKDYSGRRAGIVRALTHDVEEFYSLCDPDKENLCLYGHPNSTWEVTLPAEEVPPELPEPALGINFARDGMNRRDWLSLVAVHSDSWLLSVAFYLGARFNGNERKRLFSMINDLPTVYEMVSDRKQARDKSGVDGGSKSKPSTKRASDGPMKNNLKPVEEGFGDDEDEHSETLCGTCGGNYNANEFWIGCVATCPLLDTETSSSSTKKSHLLSLDDQEIVDSIVSGVTPSYLLESKLKDTHRAARLRRESIKLMTGRSIEGLPIDGFDYDSILGQCCEMPVGYVQLPVGVAGPLVLDGRVYYVPMATTEGCLVASTNRGCKAIGESGGAMSVVLRDAMTRAPVVRFATAMRSAELKFFLEAPANFATLALVFNRSSRFARLQGIQCSLAGRNLYMRFSCSTGDAMGMNMVSKGVQNVLDYLQSDFPDMDIISISGNFCSDKKPAAVNWIEGRGKSVVCEAIIKGEVVREVLKTSVQALVELNTVKNLAGSAVAGSIGGFNAHASNVVSAIFIATGQDPAQNVESSNCITMMEAVNDSNDLHVSVTMPSIEVGTVGGGTQLASQSACLDLLGVKGASLGTPGANARLLATIIAGAVLAGELSLMSALAAGQLVRSHMKYNRSSRDVTRAAS